VASRRAAKLSRRSGGKASSIQRGWKGSALAPGDAPEGQALEECPPHRVTVAVVFSVNGASKRISREELPTRTLNSPASATQAFFAGS
jgi:hypothetical protein